eukprot:comp23449_c0_seq1/m.39126 comp23449_c0_seq1/g.39126  ORF comp23449_c0_seq1/g.39126 comp23449_c0_seq1/m.39126 type:complete len:757 (-) comp23449_c0_seq1:146-2416(-)
MSGRYSPLIPMKGPKAPSAFSTPAPASSKRSFLPRLRFRRGHMILVLVSLTLFFGSNIVFRMFYGPGSSVIVDGNGESENREAPGGIQIQHLRGQTGGEGKKIKVTEVETEDEPKKLPEPPKLAVNVDQAGCGLLQCKAGQVSISVHSALDASIICVNGTAVVDRDTSRPGINIARIDPDSGHVVETTHFDTGRHGDDRLVEYLDGLPIGALIAVGVAKEAAFNLTPRGRVAFAQFGSWRIDAMQVGWKWALVGAKGAVSPSLHEVIEPPPQLPNPSPTATLGLCMRLGDHRLREIAAYRLCQDPDGRRNFCKELGVPMPSGDRTDRPVDAVHEVERAVLSLPTKPTLRYIQPAPWDPKLHTDLATKLPIAIVAGNRANYLIRCLKAIFKQPGVNPHLITVYTDGMYEEMANVARVFDVRLVGHTKTSSNSKKNNYFRAADQITQHYKFSLGKIYELHPDADNAIVLEEDLEVSADFLYYFSQTLPLLAQDPTLLTISAWNDNSYEKTSADPTKLYRSEFFPGLGWVLQKWIWNEIEPKWPECCQGFSWDLWLRHKLISKGRETIIPDVSRTFHFGRKGSNVNNDFFFILYFLRHSFNKDPYTRLANLDRLLPDPYYEEMEGLFARAQEVTPTNSRSCPFEVPESTLNPSNLYENVKVIWYKQLPGTEKFQHLEGIIACLQMWDLGKARGIYHTVVRGFYNGNHLLIAGDKSTFAEKYMPKNANVVEIPTNDRVRRKPTREDVELARDMRDQVEEV